MLKLLAVLLLFFGSALAQEDISAERSSYIEKAKSVGPVIYSRGTLVISQSLPVNSLEDAAKIALPVRIETGAEIFSSDLMIKDEIPAGEAAIFIFNTPESKQVIDVSKLLVTRDFAFLNKDGRVVEIRRTVNNKNIEKIITIKPVSAVLQLPEGDIKKYGFKINDEIKIETQNPLIK